MSPIGVLVSVLLAAALVVFARVVYLLVPPPPPFDIEDPDCIRDLHHRSNTLAAVVFVWGAGLAGAGLWFLGGPT